jgi:chemotaxis protein methyltransferase CheR
MAYTSFFRDADALGAIAELALPELERSREILVWDAGCATGEEPYTLAIIFASRMGPFAFRNLRILATDREESSFPQFARRVSEARYHRRDLVWVPEPLRRTYFKPTEDPELFEVVDELKEKVSFLRHDLLGLEPPGEGFSLIVCKNVLMHFAEEEKELVLGMFHRSLAPEGFLALDGAQAMPAAMAGMFRRPRLGSPLYRKAG